MNKCEFWLRLVQDDLRWLFLSSSVRWLPLLSGNRWPVGDAARVCATSATVHPVMVGALRGVTALRGAGQSFAQAHPSASGHMPEGWRFAQVRSLRITYTL